MSMQGGSWPCIAGSGAGLIKRPAPFPRPAYRLRLLREPHSGHSLVAAFTALAGMRAHIGSRAQEPHGSSLHRRMTGSQKPSTQQQILNLTAVVSGWPVRLPVFAWRCPWHTIITAVSGRHAVRNAMRPSILMSAGRLQHPHDRSVSIVISL